MHTKCSAYEYYGYNSFNILNQFLKQNLNDILCYQIQNRHGNFCKNIILKITYTQVLHIFCMWMILNKVDLNIIRNTRIIFIPITRVINIYEKHTYSVAHKWIIK